MRYTQQIAREQKKSFRLSTRAFPRYYWANSKTPCMHNGKCRHHGKKSQADRRRIRNGVGIKMKFLFQLFHPA